MLKKLGLVFRAVTRGVLPGSDLGFRDLGVGLGYRV